MNEITKKTIEILRGYAYNNDISIRQILLDCKLSTSIISNIIGRPNNLSLDACEKLLNYCGYTLKIKRK